MNASLVDKVPIEILALAANALGVKYRFSRYSSSMRATLAEWQSLEHISLDHLRARQLTSLKRVLHQAAKTPFYKHRFKAAGFEPGELTCLADLKSLPVLTREDIRDNFDRMTVPNAGIRSITRKSSGTTGEPIRFRQPYKLTYDYAYAALYQAYSWHGVLPLARRATLAGRYLGRRDDGIIIRNYSENQLLLGVHSLGPDTVGTYMSALRRFKPALLQAHPSAMLLLRELSLAQGIAPVDLPAISFTGETLFEKDRKDLMSWCSGVVFGQYGSGEHHLAAAECAMLDGYHMNPDFSYTEVLQTSLGGQIVSTSLLNDVMPLIRYQIGDLAEGIEEKPCMCGRTWPRLIGLRGRADDVLTAADGRMLAPVVFRTGLAARFSDLPPYTLIQHREKGAYTLQVFTHRPTETFSEVGGYLTRLLGPDAKVDILRVCPSNQLTMRGKHKMVVRE